MTNSISDRGQIPNSKSGTLIDRSRVIITTVFVLAIIQFVGNQQTHAQIKGVSYSISPSADFLQWNKELGLKDDGLFGGRFSINFGRFMALQGYYLTNPEIETDLSNASFDQTLQDQHLRLTNYGADIQMNLRQGRFVPFVRGGGGILKFEPDSGPDFEQITLKFGGGIRYELMPRLFGHVSVEDMVFRVDRNLLAADPGFKGVAVADPDRDKLRHNLALGFGLDFMLGGYQGSEETELDRAIRERYRSGFFGGSWIIEPYIGTLNFHNNTRLANQEFAGVRGGLNLGSMVGLRGYYWHGMKSDFGNTEPISSWGGEAQFYLSQGQGAIPYITLGAGKLDFLKDYRDQDDLNRADKGMLLVGGGVGFSLGRFARANVSVRDHIFSDSDVDMLGAPDELVHNWGFSGGLTFAFGGGSSRTSDRRDPVVPDVRSMPTAPAQSEAEVVPAPMQGSQIVPGVQAGLGRDAAAGVMLPYQSYQSDRLFTLPVPTVGEIYVRYGVPGGVSITSQPAQEQANGAVAPPPNVSSPGSGTFQSPVDTETLRRIISEELSASGISEGPAAQPQSTMSDAERMELLERRITERLESRMDDRTNVDRAGDNSVQSTTRPAETQQQDRIPSVEETSYSSSSTLSERTIYPYTGFNLDDPEQWLLGVRLDAGPITRNSRLRFVPEIAFGFFSEGSFMLAGNVQYTFRSLFKRHDIQPHVYAGAGIIRFGKGVDRDRTEAVLNLGYGVSRQFGKWTGFVEHQGVDLFSLHRLIAGIRLGI